MTTSDKIARALTDNLTPTPMSDRPVEAIVSQADATGLKVVIPSFGPQWSFGPCSYGRPLDGSSGSWAGSSSVTIPVGYPPIGTKCLVVFTVDEHPWIIAFKGWPQ